MKYNRNTQSQLAHQNGSSGAKHKQAGNQSTSSTLEASPILTGGVKQRVPSTNYLHKQAGQ
jgi:hypothetical protein